MKQFQLTQRQSEQIERWCREHKCMFTDDGQSPVCPSGAIGGRFTYTFTPTGLGVIVTVKCACGAEVDVTDYWSW